MEMTTYDEAALRQLTELAVRRAKSRRLSQDDAEDVAQDAIARLIAQPQRPDNAEAWVTRVVANLCNDRARADMRAPRDVPPDEDAQPDAALREWARSQTPVSAQGMQAETTRQFLAQIGGVFSPKEIEILVLIAEGLTYDEIADELGYKNADSVKSTVRRIRTKAEQLDRDALEELRGHPHVYRG